MFLQSFQWKNYGSQDEDNIEPDGKEFWKCLRLFEKKWLLILNVILSVASGIIPLFTNFVMSDIINLGSNKETFLSDFTSLIVRLTGVIVAMFLSNQLNILTKGYLNPSFVVDLRRLLFSSIIHQDISYFDSTTTGILISRLYEDVTLVRETYTDKTLNIIQNFSQAIGGLCLALSACWQPSLVAVGVIPLTLLMQLAGSKWVDKLWIDYSKTAGQASSKAEEVISQFRTVKAFDCEQRELDLYNKELDGVIKVYNKTSVAFGFKDGISYGFQVILIAACVYYTVYIIVRHPEQGIKNNAVSVVQFSLFFSVLAFNMLFTFSDDFKKAKISAAKILYLINRKPKIYKNEGVSIENVRGKIEFRNVKFTYASSELPALNNLSFTINAGETVAFVGESGCGKSTTLQLIQRFYDADEGEILIDGVNIKGVAPSSLRDHVSIVPQQPVLYSMSVADNIRYSKHDATDQEIYAAAQAGNAHGFISELNEGYNTVVQQTSLSGGQKQRICISRAILANAPILLLDEATAALDTESEQLVQLSLEEIRNGKTAIIVAHRLATVISADRIFVFKDGHIQETGKHEELLKKGGIYADLVKYQLQ